LGKLKISSGNKIMTSKNHYPDIRWKQRFENLQSAYQLLLDAISVIQQAADNKLIRAALIKAFEMTFELSWKTLKDYLNYNGIDVKFPRDIIKQAFANEIIMDGQLWIDMLEDRNLMSHTYDEARAQEAIEHICLHYLTGLTQLHDYLLERLNVCAD
jgi:nucleotidyltransferase substrate binding protein (TIGR01987 family)